MQCIFRKPKTLEICGKQLGADACYCKQHMKIKNVLYDVINDVIGNKRYLEEADLYALYKHIYDNVHFTNIDDSSDDAKRLFIVEILKQFSKEKLLQMHSKYFASTKATVASCKTSIINKLCSLLGNTYAVDKSLEKINRVICIQRWYYKQICRPRQDARENAGSPINKEDIFTYESIDEIPAERVFMYYDEHNHLYAFDAIELEYFVRNCKKDGLAVYNPYTKEQIKDDVVKDLYKFIVYHKLQKKDNECIWITDLQAYTDLSLEMERQGFYNSPDWFAKFGRRELLNIVKLFKDFSLMVPESRAYFQRFGGDVFNFCREGIKLFRECNEDKYILCCNFVKALAMVSSDFYYNLPDWLLQTFTNSNIMARHRNNNFLLYYYVEYLE